MKFRSILIATTSAMLLAGCNVSDQDESAPVAFDQSLTTQTDTILMGSIDANDPDGDALTYAITSAPGLGVVSLADDGSFAYTPALETTGNDMFSVSVSDGNSSIAVTIMVTIESLELDFGQYTRQAFQQSPTDMPLSVNGRTFIDNQDDDFTDLVD